MAKIERAVPYCRDEFAPERDTLSLYHAGEGLLRPPNLPWIVVVAGELVLGAEVVRVRWGEK